MKNPIRILRDIDIVGSVAYEGYRPIKKYDPIIEIKFENITDLKWNIVSPDNLPEPGVDVLIYFNGCEEGTRAHIMSEDEKLKQSFVKRSLYKKFHGIWWNHKDFFTPINNVTHWFPIPKPPKKLIS